MMNNYVIITGANKGIGKSIAHFFSLNHWKVINISRNASDKRYLNYKIDLSISGWERNLKNDIEKFIYNSDMICLVHNAACYEKDTVYSIDVEKFRNSIAINVIAPAILNRMILPYMKKCSSIIYIGSTLSCKAVKGAFSYITAKHGVVGMMRATCQDLDDTGIHTTCICPGFTDTDMLRQHIGEDQDKLNQIRSISSAKRLIDPHEIATLVFYCANNPVINGSVIHANLGQIENF